MKSHLSAVRTGLETPYTPLGRSPLLDHPPPHTHTRKRRGGGWGGVTPNVNGCLFGGREIRKSRKKKLRVGGEAERGTRKQLHTGRVLLGPGGHTVQTAAPAAGHESQLKSSLGFIPPFAFSGLH